MSDSVDDLHEAEDFAASCVGLLSDLVVGFHEGGRDLLVLDGIITRAAIRREEWFNYCRPTCQAHGDPNKTDECDEGEDCGCPCGHAAEDDSPMRGEVLTGDHD